MVVSQIDSRRVRELPVADYDNRSLTETLERRLIEGERQIAMAEALGEDTNRLVDFWIDLLHQYERSVDAFAQAA